MQNRKLLLILGGTLVSAIAITIIVAMASKAPIDNGPMAASSGPAIDLIASDQAKTERNSQPAESHTAISSMEGLRLDSVRAQSTQGRPAMDAGQARSQGSIFGQVVTDESKPLSDWRVTLREQGRNHTIGTKTSVSGEFRVDAIVGRTYELAAFDPRTALETPSATLEAVTITGEPVTLRVDQRKMASARIKAQIQDANGAPRVGAKLVICLPDGGRNESPASDSEGRIEIGPLVAASFEVLLAPPPLPTIFLGSVITHPERTTDLGIIRLPVPGSLEILLSYSERSGQSLQAGSRLAMVSRVLPPRTDIPSDLLVVADVQFDGRSGKVGDLLPGEYVVNLLAEGFGRCRRLVSIREGETSRLDVELRRGEMRRISLKFEGAQAPNEAIDLTILDSHGATVVRSADFGNSLRSGTKAYWLALDRYRIIAHSQSGRSADLECDCAGPASPNGAFDVVLR